MEPARNMETHLICQGMIETRSQREGIPIRGLTYISTVIYTTLFYTPTSRNLYVLVSTLLRDYNLTIARAFGVREYHLRQSFTVFLMRYKMSDTLQLKWLAQPDSEHLAMLARILFKSKAIMAPYAAKT